MNKKSNNNFTSGNASASDLSPEYLKEVLSALADDEISADDALTDADIVELTCKDSQARVAWQCIHITRDVMQADYHSALDSGFASRLREKIEHEETSHGGAVASMADARNARVSYGASTESHFDLWKPVAGLGLAASLAGAAFLFSQLWESQQGTDQLSVASNAEVIDIQTGGEISQAVLQTVALQDSSAMQVGNTGTRWRTNSELPRNQQIEQRLNALLTNHLEDASMGRVHGMLSHSRVVSYDSMPSKSEDF